MSAVIAVRNLRKQFHHRKRRVGFAGRLHGIVSPKYDTIQAVADISFEIHENERVAIIGPNGAGKSTTLKMLTGILEPSSGEALVFGLTPWKKREALALRIGVIFGQRHQLWSELPARDTYALLRHVYRQDRRQFEERLDRLVGQFGLSSVLDQPVNRLSLGQRMRCEIVASLLHNPALLFLDEPTIGLDIAAKSAIRDFIRDNARGERRTVVLTSHDTQDIELVCERVIVINEGRIVIDQPVAQLRARFLGRKLVTIHSASQSFQIDDLSGLTLRSSTPHKTVFQVDTARVRVEQVIAAAVSIGGIEDITIEDPPMEEVIREIYSSTAQAIA